MKKAKIILIVILLLSVVGGSFALRAFRGNNVIVYVDTFVSGNTLCTVPAIVVDRTTDPGTGGVASTIRANLTPLNAPCPTITLYVNL